MTLSSEKNWYEILDVSPSATSSMIKIAYRKLVRIYHPDLNGGRKDYAEKFKEITEAYETLSDEVKRRNYDILRNIKTGSYHSRTEGFQKKEYKSEYKKQAQKQEEESFSDLLNEFWTGFRKTTSSYKNDRPKRGTDVETEVSVTMPEAKDGTVRTINILHTQICPKCQGRIFLNGETCTACNGKGEQSVHKKLTVKIPKNTKHGSKIRIPNEGNAGSKGGSNGDLYLKIKVENDSPFTYDGLNVLYTLPITPFEAVLGTSIQVKTVNGKVNMKIMPNTHNGQKFRLAEEGIAQNNKKGDMIVTVKIEIPKKISKQEWLLYNQLKDINNTDIRR